MTVMSRLRTSTNRTHDECSSTYMDWWRVGLLGCALLGGCTESLVESSEEPSACGAGRSAGGSDDGRPDDGGPDESLSYCDGTPPAEDTYACDSATITCAGPGSASAEDCTFGAYVSEGGSAAMGCMVQWLASGDGGRIRWSLEGPFDSAVSLEVARWEGREGLPVYRLFDWGGSHWNGAGAVGTPVAIDGEEDPIARGAAMCLESAETVEGHTFTCLMDVLSSRPPLDCPDFEPEPDDSSPPSDLPAPFEPDEPDDPGDGC